MVKLKNLRRYKKRKFSYNFFKKKILIRRTFYYHILEIKSSYNNLFVNFFKYQNMKRKQLYYISSGIIFENSAKIDKFSSIKLADVVIGFILFKKVKRIVVKVLSVDRRIKKFVLALNNYKNLKFGFFFLFYLNYLRFVFNGVKSRGKQR